MIGQTDLSFRVFKMFPFHAFGMCTVEFATVGMWSSSILSAFSNRLQRQSGQDDKSIQLEWRTDDIVSIA